MDIPVTSCSHAIEEYKHALINTNFLPLCTRCSSSEGRIQPERDL